MTQFKIVVPLLATVLVGCTEAPGPRDSKDLILEIGGAQLAMRVPAEAEVRINTSQKGGFVIDFRPGHRQPRTITLWPAPASAPKGHRSRTLSSGARLLFVVTTPGGGSGGTEALLTGVLRLGGLSLGVECHTQRELPPPDPMWCIPALETLRIIKSG